MGESNAVAKGEVSRNESLIAAATSIVRVGDEVASREDRLSGKQFAVLEADTELGLRVVESLNDRSRARGTKVSAGSQVALGALVSRANDVGSGGQRRGSGDGTVTSREGEGSGGSSSGSRAEVGRRSTSRAGHTQGTSDVDGSVSVTRASPAKELIGHHGVSRAAPFEEELVITLVARAVVSINTSKDLVVDHGASGIKATRAVRVGPSNEDRALAVGASGASSISRAHNSGYDQEGEEGRHARDGSHDGTEQLWHAAPPRLRTVRGAAL